MDCIDMTTEGAAGSAARIGAAHLAPGVLDEWVIQLAEPRLFVIDETPRLQSQLLLATLDMDALADGGWPQRMNVTHRLVLAPTVEVFPLGRLSEGARPRISPTAAIGVADAQIEPDAVRLVGRALAGAVTTGALPIGPPSVRVMFSAAVGTAAVMSNLVTVVRMTA